MTNKEQEVFNLIINYDKENGTMPSFRYIQKALQYKSINSITQYIKSLTKKGYIQVNNHKLSINRNTIDNKNMKRIKIINMNNKYTELPLNYRKNYLAYKITNDYFNNMGILKNDLLIFEKNKKLKKNSLGLFIIDHKYRVMQYQNKDGFFILNDNETIILNRIKIEGKLIKVIRTI